MAYKRILTIQDISCVGHCSMAVAFPVLSVCGHETCMLPSKLLSTHTGGFGQPSVTDLSAAMPQIAAHWQQQGITFDAVLVGYLGSAAAVRCVESCVDSLLAPGGKLIVDPAMADHGRLYSGLEEEYAQAMIRLCMRADVMLPNLTEAAMMAGVPYRDDLDPEAVDALLERLGGKTVILTGVGATPEETGAAVRTEQGILRYSHRRVERGFHGTGDLFAACFTGAWLRGLSLFDAVKVAADFTLLCIEDTWRDPAHWYGVKFEPSLPQLMRML